MTIAWIVEDGAAVEEGEVLVRFDATQMELELLEGRLARSTAELKMEQRKAQKGATLQTVERGRQLAELELDMAENLAGKDPQIFSRVEIIEAEIDKDLANKKLDHAAGRAAIEEELSSSELELLEIERTLAATKMDVATEGLRALEVRAPHAGIVLLDRNWQGVPVQVGDVAYGRHAVAELPALDEMEAEVHVLEADAGDLVEGQTASVMVAGKPRYDLQRDGPLRRPDAQAEAARLTRSVFRRPARARSHRSRSDEAGSTCASHLVATGSEGRSRRSAPSAPSDRRRDRRLPARGEHLRGSARLHRGPLL